MSSAPHEAKPRAGGRHYAWWIMVSCCAMMATGLGINGSVQSIFIKPVAESLGTGIGAVSLHMTIRSLMATAFMPLAGRFLRKYDVRIVLSAAFLLQGVCQVLLSTLTALPQFYVVSGLSGIASACIMYIPVPMLISNWFFAKTGTVLGIATAFSGLAGAIFTPIGNAIIQNSGWQVAYRVLGVAGMAIALPFTLFVIRGAPADKGLLPYGLVPGAAGQAKEDKMEHEGVAAKAAVKMPAFYLIALFAMAVNLTASLVMHIPGLTESKGFGVTGGAMAVSLFTVGIIVGKLAVGSLSDRLGPKRAIYIIAGMGLAGVVGILVNPGIAALHFAGAFCLGMCTALATLGPPLVIQARFGRRDYTAINSYVSTACALAGAFGTSIYGFVYDLTGSYDSDLVFLVVVLVTGLAALTVALRQKQNVAKKGE